MKGKLIFEEVQRFRYTWSWYLMLIVSVPVVGVFLYGINVQIIHGEPWGDKPMDNMSLLLVTLFVIIIMGGVFLFLDLHKLLVRVDEGSVRYAFQPYFSTFKSLEKTKIKTIAVQKYKPVSEFGGWGYRMRWKSKAYTVSGKWGLRIEFIDGKKLTIGTQKPVELQKAIDRLKLKWEQDNYA
jgi:hypothetical protein